MNVMVRVLHIISGLNRRAGGPARSSQGLVATLYGEGVDAWICSFDGVDPWIDGARRLRVAGTLTAEDLRAFDLVHIHGIWDWRLHEVAVLCRKIGVPYVIAPRGMLEPWSLKQKWFKKRIARWMYQDRDLKCASALHATAESEAEQFRKLGFRNKIIVSPNGVNVSVSLSARAHLALGSNKTRRALFVSRMHPKKGVLELVESWARVNPKGWQCELVYTLNGDEERAYEQKVKARILELGMSYQDKDGTLHSATPTSDYDFLLTGPLDDDKKWGAYARADLFVLPTYSENFGIVVAEALWSGVPVITTKGTPWAELEGNRCGWWIELPPRSTLDDALFCATRLPRTELSEMGRRGRELVERKYTWKAVCDKMIAGYEEVLNGRA